MTPAKKSYCVLTGKLTDSLPAVSAQQQRWYSEPATGAAFLHLGEDFASRIFAATQAKLGRTIPYAQGSSAQLARYLPHRVTTTAKFSEALIPQMNLGDVIAKLSKQYPAVDNVSFNNQGGDLHISGSYPQEIICWVMPWSRPPSKFLSR